MYHVLDRHFDEVKLIQEDPISKRSLLKGRIKRIGLWQVMGQVLFITLVNPILKRKAGKRQKSILKAFGYTNQAIPNQAISKTDSVNHSATIELIKAAQPNFIIVNGTRIIKAGIISAIGQPIYNIHVGITPKYRGVHGGYHALANGDNQLFGTTLHKVDTGIDSGMIIAQKTGQISTDDNFATYPTLQYCYGLNLLETHLETLLSGEYKSAAPLTTESQLHYHPTIWRYFWTRWSKGIK